MMWRILKTALFLLAGAGCGRSGGGGEDRALVDGAYEVDGPVCASTGLPPAYPAANYKATLLDFFDLKSHTLTVEALVSAEEFVDADCSLTVKRGIFRNVDPEFSHRRNRQHRFDPEGCSLQVEHDGAIWDVDAAHTSLFTDSSDLSEEVPMIVSMGPDSKPRLTTADRPGVSDFWAAYGCAATDQLIYTLTR